MVWKVFNALFLLLIASFISEFHQGTRGFVVKILVLPIDMLAAFIIVSDMWAISVSIGQSVGG